MKQSMVVGEGVTWTREARKAWRESMKRRECSEAAMRVSVRPEDAKRMGFASLPAIADALGVPSSRLRCWYNRHAKDRVKIHWMELTGNCRLYQAREMKLAYRAWERAGKAAVSASAAPAWVTTEEAARMLGYSSASAARHALHRRFVRSRRVRAGGNGSALMWYRVEVDELAEKRRKEKADAVPEGYVHVREVMKIFCRARASYTRWMNMGLLRGVLLRREVNGIFQEYLYVKVDDLLKVASMKLDKLISGVSELRGVLRRFDELKSASGEGAKRPRKTKVKKGS